jgi:hypothetical protein
VADTGFTYVNKNSLPDKTEIFVDSGIKKKKTKAKQYKLK